MIGKTQSKRCRRCKDIKLFGEFHKDRTSNDGRQAWCKKCASNDRRSRCSDAYEGEHWRQIKGFGGRYLISSYGRVMSVFDCGHEKDRGAWKKEHLKIVSLSKKIYSPANRAVVVGLTNRLTDENIPAARVSRLVAEYFLEIDKRARVFHKDGNFENNHIENLFVTHRDPKVVALELKSQPVVDDKEKSKIIESFIAYMEGDDLAADFIVDAVLPPMRMAQWKILRNFDLTEEASQEAIIRVLEALRRGQYVKAESPIGWCVQIAKNLALNMRRKVAKMKEKNCDPSLIDANAIFS